MDQLDESSDEEFKYALDRALAASLADDSG